MKKHLGLTCIAYALFGVGITVQQLGLKAGLSLELTLGIFISTSVFYIIVVLTSMEKLKSVLFKKDEVPTSSPIEKQMCGVGENIT